MLQIKRIMKMDKESHHLVSHLFPNRDAEGAPSLKSVNVCEYTCAKFCIFSCCKPLTIKIMVLIHNCCTFMSLKVSSPVPGKTVIY